jgi:hypothetical protein
MGNESDAAPGEVQSSKLKAQKKLQVQSSMLLSTVAAAILGWQQAGFQPGGRMPPY